MPGNTTLSIAILSGKGGVGKSNIALNLAFALNKMSAKVLIIDCDLGLANLDVLLGLTPQQNIQNIMLDNVNPAELVIKLEEGLDILPANSGILENLEDDSLLPEVLAEKMLDFTHNYDFVFLDVGAGIAETVLEFGAMAMSRIIVITPEPTSLTDSYALIKVLDSRYNVREHLVMVNQVSSAKEKEMSFNRLQGACSHFLGFQPMLLGSVRNDPKLVESVRQQKPCINLYPQSKASIDIAVIANKLIKMRSNILPHIAEREPLMRPGTRKV